MSRRCRDDDDVMLSCCGGEWDCGMDVEREERGAGIDLGVVCGDRAQLCVRGAIEDVERERHRDVTRAAARHSTAASRLLLLIVSARRVLPT